MKTDKNRIPNSYDASQIEVLEGLEAVRKRPGMYIGSTSLTGIHHLIWEIVDNSIDEAMAGYANKINIEIEKDNRVKITDNGRGIPVDIQHKTGRPASETVFTVLHAGGKFGGGSYKVSGGLHGVGAAVVNALSKFLEYEIYRDGKIYHQRFEQGIPVTELKINGKSENTGSVVYFRPDEEIFKESIDFDFDILADRVQELAYLNRNLLITLTDSRGENVKKREYQYDGGIKSYVEYLNENKDVLYDEPIFLEDEQDDIIVEVALQHTTGYHLNLLSFANNIHTHEGGTHESGFKAALTRVINDYARRNNHLKEEDDNFLGEDVREGLGVIISIKHPDPQFEGQTKTKLGNSEARTIVDRLFSANFDRFLMENPEIAKKIVEKAELAASARMAAKRARENDS